MQRQVGGGRIGVDVGGTFTDFAFLDDAGQVHALKLPTNRDTPAAPVLEGTDRLLARLGATSVSAFVHGTTLATNTVIERTGARTGLLVTQGFRDILEIGRLRLPDTTNFDGEKPAPLVPRQLVVEIDERILASGRTDRPLDPDEVRRSVRNLLEHGVDAIGICFLHAFTNPEHERIAVQVIRSEFPGIYVSASHEVWPQQREYERCLVTVMNSYIGRRLSTYLSELQYGLTERHLLSRFHVTRSNGGMMTAEGAIRLPIATLLSGPASGSRVLAIDDDPVAVDVASANVQANEVADRVTVVAADLLTPILTPVDLLTANLTAEVLTLMAAAIPARLRPGGVVIASGIIAAGVDGVGEAFAHAGLRIEETRAQEEWRALVAQRPPGPAARA